MRDFYDSVIRTTLLQNVVLLFSRKQRLATVFCSYLVLLFYTVKSIICVTFTLFFVLGCLEELSVRKLM